MIAASFSSSRESTFKRKARKEKSEFLVAVRKHFALHFAAFHLHLPMSSLFVQAEYKKYNASTYISVN